jgi:hypothetical protein
MERLTTQELYTQLQERIVLDLKDNEIFCTECKGMRFVYVQQGDKGYIESCRHCYNGKLYVCKFCGKNNRTNSCDCRQAQDESHNAFRLQQAQKDFTNYQKAEKINYKDYDGYYLLGNSERLQDLDYLYEWIKYKLINDEDVPEYVWAGEEDSRMSIDLQEIISDKCEDGYEDMNDYLKTDSTLLSQAQDLINQWEKEQGDNLCVFSETYSKAIVIKDLIEEIKNEISK